MYKFEYDGNKTWFSPQGYSLEESKELFYKQTHWESCMAEITEKAPDCINFNHENKLINIAVKRFDDFLNVCDSIVDSADARELRELDKELAKINLDSPWILYDCCEYLKETLDKKLGQLENEDS